MSDPQLPPEQWRPLFEKINIEFGYRPLGTYLDMDHTRLRRLLLGGGTSETAIRRVAEGFGVTPDLIRELRGDFASGIKPFTLPDDAGRLTESERDVVRSMVRALLNARDGNDEHSSDNDTGTSEAPRTPGKARKEQKTLDEVEGSMPLGTSGSTSVNRRKNRDKLGNITDGEVG